MAADLLPPKHALGATLMAAAALVTAASPAGAETAPERASLSLRYLDYLDSQPDLERIRIRAPSLMLSVPVANTWLIEGAYVADAVSGASPAFHTVARSASPITDRREAVDAKLARYWPWGTVKLGAAYSTESDYVSRALSVQASVSTEDKNRTFNLGLGVTRDRINPVNDRVNDERKATHDVALGLTQVLTPTDLVQLNLTYASGRGYFSDPYKFLDERPRERDQTVLLMRWNHHFVAVEGTARSSYRYYTDSWNIKAHTLTLEYVQTLPWGWSLTPLLRLYSQGAARFYVDVNAASPTRPRLPAGYVSGETLLSYDQRLSAFGARTFGIKLAKQINDDWLADVKVEDYAQRSSWHFGGDGSPGLATFKARMVQLGVTRLF